MKESLLEDFNYIENYELSEDNKRGNKYFLRGVLSRADVVNRNKRIYPRAVWEDCIREAQPIIENRGLVGELDHPPTPKINVERISHVVTKMALAEDGAVIGELEVISSTLKELMKAKIRLGVSTRGLGQVKPYNGPLGEGLVEVLPGYRLKALDVVFDPSAGTFPDVVVEDTNIVLGSTKKFREIWEEVFNKND